VHIEVIIDIQWQCVIGHIPNHRIFRGIDEDIGHREIQRWEIRQQDFGRHGILCCVEQRDFSEFPSSQVRRHLGDVGQRQ